MLGQKTPGAVASAAADVAVNVAAVIITFGIIFKVAVA